MTAASVLVGVAVPAVSRPVLSPSGAWVVLLGADEGAAADDEGEDEDDEAEADEATKTVPELILSRLRLRDTICVSP